MSRRSEYISKDIQMINRYMKRSLVSLIIREMQIKTTMSYHLTSINGYYQKKEKKKTGNKCW